MKNNFKILLIVFIIFLYTNPMQAQDARMYLNVPRGTNVVQFNVINSNSAMDNADGLENQITDSKTYLPVYYYVFKGLWDRTASIGANVPIVDYFSYDKVSDSVLNDLVGMGDISLTLDHNFYGGMSMSKEEFAKTPPRNFAGIHLVFTIPTGSYNPSNTTNIGSNRYALKILLQQSFILNKATAWLDIYASATIYWNNDDYEGSNTLSQNAIYKLYTYYSQNIASPKTWAEIGMVYSYGGDIFINGAEQVGNQSTIQGALGLSATIWKKGTIRALYMPTFYDNRANFHRGYSVQFRYQQLF